MNEQNAVAPAPTNDGFGSLPRRTTVVEDMQYETMIMTMQRRVIESVAAGEKLFTTNSDSLFGAYLAGLPLDLLQYHLCSCCNSFLNRYGGLVTIDEEGRTHPLLWPEEPEFGVYNLSVDRMRHLVKTSPVTGVFLSSKEVLGIRSSGGFHHFAVGLPPEARYRSETLTDGQAKAAKREDLAILMRGLSGFRSIHIDQAVGLLETDQVYRGEKLLGAAQFLQKARHIFDLHTGNVRRNLLWRMVASAPPGYCRPQTTMIGTIVDDIAKGKSAVQILAAVREKMDPLQYQRPTAAPKDGAITAAEKLVEQMGLTSALRRRHARLDEIKMRWTPKPVQPSESTGGVFGHLRANDSAALNLIGPAKPMTVSKFILDVLPTADRIQVKMEARGIPMAMFITAVDPEAKPIVQWDEPDSRNPVTWSCPAHGADPIDVGLKPHEWIEVPGIASQPSGWGPSPEKYKHHGACMFIFLQGATPGPTSSQGLFPEHTRSDLHAVRSVIEAHFRKHHPEGSDQPGTANAIMAHPGSGTLNCVLRVHAGAIVRDIVLDRWE